VNGFYRPLKVETRVRTLLGLLVEVDGLRLDVFTFRGNLDVSRRRSVPPYWPMSLRPV
jgi:hypothetical protein